jgi:hypothetical protein
LYNTTSTQLHLESISKPSGANTRDGTREKQKKQETPKKTTEAARVCSQGFEKRIKMLKYDNNQIGDSRLICVYLRFTAKS